MEPSRERDGVLGSAPLERATLMLQWSRRANATECEIAVSVARGGERLQWSRRANATECQPATGTRRANPSFNGAVARTRRSGRKKGDIS